MTWRRLFTWAIVGAAALAGVMLKDLSGLLGDIQTSGSHSYDAGVFTGAHFRFWDTTELRDAIVVWRKDGALVADLITAHAWIDAVVFVPALAAILWKVLRRVGVSFGFALSIAVAYAVVDVLETIMTGCVLPDLVDRPGTEVPELASLVVIQATTLVKTLLLLAAVVVTAVALFVVEDEVTAQGGWNAVQEARTGGEQAPALALAWIIVLVGIFAVTVALPGGGPLDQLPDVIRQHLSEAGLGLWTWSTLGLFTCVAAVAVAALVATSPGGRSARDGTVPDWAVLAGAAVFSGACFLWAKGEGPWRVGPFAPLFVFVGLWIASWLARWAGVAGAPPQGEIPDERSTWTSLSIAWAGGLAGVVAVAGAIGLVRAAFPPLVLGIETEGFPWSMALLFGCTGAVVAGFGVQVIVETVAGWRPPLHRFLGATVAGGAVLSAGWIAFSPRAGESWGSTGVVGVSFGFWALVIGLLVWVSRTRRRWDVTRYLGFGARTPWVTLLLVLGLAGGALNKDSGYHDARLVDSAYAARHQSRYDAFTKWKQAIHDTCSPRPGQAVPMVFVAAPGGGIRAAYWTASALERLFESPCREAQVFAISGVSGGSVGAATWVASNAAGGSAKVAVTAMSRDTALPRALAGLLLRDMVQPLTGNGHAWEDRAALMEEGWAEAARVFGDPDRPTAWSRAGNGLPFVPVLALNGSSVTDGCMVLVTNLAGLPASRGPDCQGVPSPGRPVKGPVSGSIDPFVGLRRRVDGCGGSGVDVGITSGALLSARFPIVSPSGGLVRCVDGEEIDTAVVDGGYYEGSGLLTLLQVWDGFDEMIADHNFPPGRRSGLPLASNPIEPWFLVVDNHYRAVAKKLPPGAPMELFAPLDALGKEVVTQTTLEQTAIWQMRDSRGMPRFVFLSPAQGPGVEAPLGWVLSAASRTDLDVELDEQVGANNPALQRLLQRLL